MTRDIPVTVIGGYLGAGKTSLVNHVLRHADGVRLAILVNEFGALPIDKDLIVTQDEDMISIAGGCVCCSYGSDMAAALMDMRALDPPPDHVLLEASGVALPGAIAGAVGLLQGVTMDGVVIMTDAETLERNAAHKYMGDTVTRQLADADLVVLNKADLVDPEDLAARRSFAAGYATAAQIVETQHGRLPPDVVMQSFVGRDRAADARHDVSGFDSVSIAMNAACYPQVVARVLASAELGLVRAKGFVKSDAGGVFSVQCVSRRWAVEPAEDDAPLGIVCIGVTPEFDAARVRNAVQSAM